MAEFVLKGEDENSSFWSGATAPPIIEKSQMSSGHQISPTEVTVKRLRLSVCRLVYCIDTYNICIV